MVPRLPSFAGTDSVMSTQMVRTATGSRFPTAIACSAGASIRQTPAPSSAFANPFAIRAAAGRYAVTHLVLDEGMLSRHGLGTEVGKVAGQHLETGAFKVAYASTSSTFSPSYPGPKARAPALASSWFHARNIAIPGRAN